MQYHWNNILRVECKRDAILTQMVQRPLKKSVTTIKQFLISATFQETSFIPVLFNGIH